MSKHTPTPWEATHIEIHPAGNSFFTVARVRGFALDEARANAEFVVRACNSFDDLLAALEGVIRVADRATVEFDAARAAVAKAKGVAP